MYPFFSENPVGQRGPGKVCLLLGVYSFPAWFEWLISILSSLLIMVFDQKQEVQSELPGMIQDYQ